MDGVTKRYPILGAGVTNREGKVQCEYYPHAFKKGIAIHYSLLMS